MKNQKQQSKALYKRSAHAKSGQRRAQKATRYDANRRGATGGQSRRQPERGEEKKNEWAAFLTAQRANTFGRLREKA